MQSMIITPNPSDPEVRILCNEFEKKGYNVEYFIPSTMKVMVSFKEKFKEKFENLEPRAALVRGFGVAATQKIFFRLDSHTFIPIDCANSSISLGMRMQAEYFSTGWSFSSFQSRPKAGRYTLSWSEGVPSAMAFLYAFWVRTS